MTWHRWHVVISPQKVGHIRPLRRHDPDRTLCGKRARGRGWHYLVGSQDTTAITCRSCARRLPL